MKSGRMDGCMDTAGPTYTNHSDDLKRQKKVHLYGNYRQDLPVTTVVELVCVGGGCVVRVAS